MKQLLQKDHKTEEDKKDIKDMKLQIKVSREEIEILKPRKENYQPGSIIQPYFD